MRRGSTRPRRRVVAAAGDGDEAARLVELLGRRPQPEALLDLSGYAVKGTTTTSRRARRSSRRR